MMTMQNQHYYSRKRNVFYPKHHQIQFLGLFCQIQTKKKFQIFDQNHGLNP